MNGCQRSRIMGIQNCAKLLDHSALLLSCNYPLKLCNIWPLDFCASLLNLTSHTLLLKLDFRHGSGDAIIFTKQIYLES